MRIRVIGEHFAMPVCKHTLTPYQTGVCGVSGVSGVVVGGVCFHERLKGVGTSSATLWGKGAVIRLVVSVER